MSKLFEIASLVRNHYIFHLRNEFEKLEEHAIYEFLFGDHEVDSRLIECDLELEPSSTLISLADIKPDLTPDETSLYRHDLVTYDKNKPVITELCWPVQKNIIEDKLEEDIPWFTPAKFQINTTEVLVNPFPWFNCEIVLYPNAEPVKGILDAWFYKWYYRKTKSYPFLNVIHHISGPYSDHGAGESYFIDLGSAPHQAFTDLIFNVSRKEIERIVIR